jgi:hypothetical protein
MALFSDGLVSEVADLVAYEANLPELAAAEGIDLEAKLGLAHNEIAVELEAASRGPGNIYYARGAGWQSSGGEANLSRFGLEQVVVTPPLRLLHTFQALAIVYRDAYNRKVNDKYLPKWQEYKDLARWARDLLLQTGIGITANPVPRPKPPALDWVAAGLAAAALFVRMTWLDERGVEGAGSAEQAVQVPDGNALRVTPPGAIEGASGWHVYVGTASGKLRRQNGAPLDLGNPWTMPAGGVVSGPELGDGQAPDVLKSVPRFLQRG